MRLLRVLLIECAQISHCLNDLLHLINLTNAVNYSKNLANNQSIILNHSDFRGNPPPLLFHRHISPWAGAARIGNIKSNKPFKRIVLVRNSIHCFHIFLQVQTSEHTFFNFLILRKSRFPPKTSTTCNHQSSFDDISLGKSSQKPTSLHHHFTSIEEVWGNNSLILPLAISNRNPWLIYRERKALVFRLKLFTFAFPLFS